jgi:hypothetical protein
MEVWRHGSDKIKHANDEVRCSSSYVHVDPPKLTHFLSCCCCPGNCSFQIDEDYRDGSLLFAGCLVSCCCWFIGQ